MGDIIKAKRRGDYPVIIKMVDGKSIECVNIDALTDEQFKQYCRDSGTEYFPRTNFTVKSEQ